MARDSRGRAREPQASWPLLAFAYIAGDGTAYYLASLYPAVLGLGALPAADWIVRTRFRARPDQGETVGWPRFIDAVTGAWHAIPRGERAHAAIFTQNYGEAGAVEVLGGSHGLPRAYSGHNGFGEWGMPPETDTHVLLIGYDRSAYAAPYFTGCRALATVDNGVGLENDQQGMPLLLCGPTTPWQTLWPRLRHYG